MLHSGATEVTRAASGLAMSLTAVRMYEARSTPSGEEGDDTEKGPVEFWRCHPYKLDEHEERQGNPVQGKTNGELLRAAENAGYNVLLTVDQGMPHQQHLASRTLAIIVVQSRTIKSKTCCRWWIRFERR